MIPNVSDILFTNSLTKTQQVQQFWYIKSTYHDPLSQKNLTSKKEPRKNLSHPHETIYMGAEIY